MKVFTLSILVLIAAVALSGNVYARDAAAKAPAVDVRIEPDRAVISNSLLRIEMTLKAGRARTSLVKNLRTQRDLSLEGDDFAVEFEDGRVIRSGELKVKKVARVTPGAGRAQLVLDYAAKDAQVRMVTEMQAGHWWATRWLEIRGAMGTLSRVSLALWLCDGATGTSGAGKTVRALGYPSGCGQAIYARDCFFGIAHPGAENFVARQGENSEPSGMLCAIPAYEILTPQKPVVTRKLVIGAGEAGDARRALLGYIDKTRAVPARMIFLVNDWYWKDKSKPLEALKELVRVKKESGVPIDSFTLDDGWDFDWDEKTKIWGRLHRRRFPGGWDALETIGQAADINISLWFGPIGGYAYRPRRIEFARKVGFEIQNGKLCLAGTRYQKHVVESFSHWAAKGMDYIKVDGFWPNCPVKDHGHPASPIAQIDALIDVFAAWHRAGPNLLIAYTSGSNPSPFWLQHVDFVWRGGIDDAHAGVGEPFDRNNTYLDSILQMHRQTDMPMSAFVTFDIVQGRIEGNRDETFERGCWWLAARTSLHHDWYIQASDLTLARWKTLARVAQWAKQHEAVFRFSRMVGGDPAKGEVYGFSAFHSGRGTLALRNPSGEPKVLDSTLSRLLQLPDTAAGYSLKLRGVAGETKLLEGVHKSDATLHMELPPLAIAVFEVEMPAP